MSINKLSGVTWTSISKVDGVAASGISKVAGVDAPSVSYFLDTYPNPVAAYSLRKLSSSVNTAIQVENSSGGLATIGFDSNGDLDTAALASHCGSNYGRVVTWYDQSGNGNHMTQSTASSRPYIVDASGNVITTTTNSIPAIDFYFGSTARWLEDTFVTNNGDHFLLSCLVEFRTVSTGQSIFSQWTASQSTQVMQLQCLATTNQWRITARYNNASRNLGRVNTNAALSINTEYILNSYMSASPYEGDIDFNGDTASTEVGFPTTGSINNSSLLAAIGRRSDTGAAQYQGYVSELVLWSDTTLPDRDSVMTSINDNYSVY